jgi:hypothetical protein
MLVARFLPFGPMRSRATLLYFISQSLTHLPFSHCRDSITAHDDALIKRKGCDAEGGWQFCIEMHTGHASMYA